MSSPASPGVGKLRATAGACTRPYPVSRCSAVLAGASVGARRSGSAGRARAPNQRSTQASSRAGSKSPTTTSVTLSGRKKRAAWALTSSSVAPASSSMLPTSRPRYGPPVNEPRWSMAWKGP